MTRERPANATSLAARLRNLCRERGIPEGRARRLLGVVVVGQLLARHRLGVLKGASNLEVRLGTSRTRVSRDLDTVRGVSLEDFRDTLADALREGWEGFAGLVADRGAVDVPVPAAYRPHRLRVSLSYRGGSFTSLVVDVSPEEVGALDAIDAIASDDAAAWCEGLGLPAPTAVPLLALPYQVAQKLHACTAPDTDAWTNDRVHDLVDLQLVMEGYTGDHREIKEAAVQLFAYRNLHRWPPAVTVREGWADRYAQEATDLGVIADLDSAIEWANTLVARIRDA